ncbi:MAG: hypothetical protein ACRCSN_02000 [Dermatophilaceae bacterium]
MTRTAPPAEPTVPATASDGLPPSRRAVTRAARTVLALGIWSPVLLVPTWWILDDVALRDVLVFAALVLLAGTAPGVVLWRSIRPADGSWAEDLTVGFAVGLALGLVAQLAAVVTGCAALGIIVPFLPLLVLLHPSRRRRVRASRCAAAPWWVHGVAAASTSVSILALRTWFAGQEVVPSPARVMPYIDNHFHLALVGQLLERGPTSTPALQGHSLDYHWFTHGWMAWAAAVTDVEPIVVLLRLHPAIMPLLVALAVVGGTRRVSGSWAAAAVAAPLTFLTAQANVFGQFSLQGPPTPASPTLAPGVPLTVAVFMAMVLRWRGQARGDALVLVAVLGFVAACTKGSTLPPLIAGVGLAAVAGVIWRHRASRTMWVDLGVLVGVLVAAVVVVFQGATGGIRLDVTDSISQTTLARIVWPERDVVPPQSVLVLAGVTAFVGSLARAGGLVVLALDERARREPALWVGFGAALAGAGAVVLFWHSGTSQLYFLFSSVPLAAIGSATGLVVLLRRLRPWWLRATVVAASAGVALAVTVVVPTTRAITNTRPPLGGVTAPAVVDAAISDAYALARTGAVVLGVGGALLLLLVLVCRGRRTATAGVVVAVLGVTASWGSGVDPIERTAEGPVAAEPVLAAAGPERAAQLRRPLAVSWDMVDAARWIRDNSDRDDVVMTNRHCVTPRDPLPRCDSRRWLVSAFSQRQAFVESWAYTSTAVRLNPEGTGAIVEPYWNRRDLALNDGFYTEPTADAARALWCRGVRWVYVDRLLPTSDDLEEHAPLRLRNADAEVRELAPPTAGC